MRVSPIPVSLLSLAFTACAHFDMMGGQAREGDQDAQNVRIPAAADRLADFEAGENQEVFWGGSKEKEWPIFANMNKQILTIIHRQTKEVRGQSRAQRAFHSKGHACLRGEMVLVKDRPLSTRQGIFADAYSNQRWKFWGRFSNGAGWVQRDTAPDVRASSRPPTCRRCCRWCAASSREPTRISSSGSTPPGE